jgi:predicted 2-oxoglutarate/Fe(II)-dependent dioxygenase YbiX|tara:strand:- start:223 stop:774 length:552 start_codon:yes stop_codon:yes gene_type:complete
MTDYLEAIIHLPNILNPEFCKRIQTFINKKAKKNLKIGASTVNKNIRNVKGYHLNFDTPTNTFYWNYIKQEIERLIIFYKVKFPLATGKKVEQIDLLKYELGGKYSPHIDDTSYSPRLLSVILNINDDYEGGELCFFDQKYNEVKSLKLVKGSIVFFPSNFMYPHTIKPITKGQRYSIVSWLR